MCQHSLSIYSKKKLNTCMKRLFNINNHMKNDLIRRIETKRKGKRDSWKRMERKRIEKWDSLGERQCFRG